MTTPKTVHHVAFKDKAARLKPRIVRFVYVAKGVTYSHTSPYMGTTNTQSYCPGRDVRSAVVEA